MKRSRTTASPEAAITDSSVCDETTQDLDADIAANPLLMKRSRTATSPEATRAQNLEECLWSAYQTLGGSYPILALSIPSRGSARIGERGAEPVASSSSFQAQFATLRLPQFVYDKLVCFLTIADYHCLAATSGVFWNVLEHKAACASESERSGMSGLARHQAAAFVLAELTSQLGVSAVALRRAMTQSNALFTGARCLKASLEGTASVDKWGASDFDFIVPVSGSEPSQYHDALTSLLTRTLPCAPPMTLREWENYPSEASTYAAPMGVNWMSDPHDAYLSWSDHGVSVSRPNERLWKAMTHDEPIFHSSSLLSSLASVSSTSSSYSALSSSDVSSSVSSSASSAASSSAASSTSSSCHSLSSSSGSYFLSHDDDIEDTVDTEAKRTHGRVWKMDNSHRPDLTTEQRGRLGLIYNLPGLVARRVFRLGMQRKMHYAKGSVIEAAWLAAEKREGPPRQIDICYIDTNAVRELIGRMDLLLPHTQRISPLLVNDRDVLKAWIVLGYDLDFLKNAFDGRTMVLYAHRAIRLRTHLCPSTWPLLFQFAGMRRPEYETAVSKLFSRKHDASEFPPEFNSEGVAAEQTREQHRIIQYQRRGFTVSLTPQRDPPS